MSGYIKLHRSMLKWEWLDDPITCQVWIYCLLRANYEAQRWHGEIIQPGQFVTSLSHMAKELGISVQNVRTAILHLKSTHELTSQVTKSATLITVEKWAQYQSAGDKVTNHLTHELTSDQQGANKELTTIKEYKEYKELNKKERDIRERPDIRDAERYDPVQYLTEEESNEMIKMDHEYFAPIKAKIALEAAERIKEREARS
ncbi:MAG: hypothetical protein IJI87_07560 [Mogibacterium sp.]|nr:hypothetical protein [Mogibacterium sp.]